MKTDKKVQKVLQSYKNIEISSKGNMNIFVVNINMNDKKEVQINNNSTIIERKNKGFINIIFKFLKLLCEQVLKLL